MRKIITRFAPSPTGALHIGTARTALFNYLFAKKMGGDFLLRIENTDSARNKAQSYSEILQSLKWLQIQWDKKIVFQSKNIERHYTIAQEMIKKGHAYYCFVSSQEVEQQRKEKLNSKDTLIFKSPWRNASIENHPKNIKPVIRLKVPQQGKTEFYDAVKKNVAVENRLIEDIVLIRQDKTPTYIFASAIDDYDMKISHVIRGEDHLTNTSKQIVIYNYLNWQIPQMVHLPLIADQEGKKLSKRFGAKSVLEYAKMGYMPEALTNYMLKLGWSYKDKEIFSFAEQKSLFCLSNLNTSQAKFDLNKLNHINHVHINAKSDDELTTAIVKILKEYEIDLSVADEKKILRAMPQIKQRVFSLNELKDKSMIYLSHFPVKIPSNLAHIMYDLTEQKKQIILKLIDETQNMSAQDIEMTFKKYSKQYNVKLHEIIKPIRVAISGQMQSESVFHILSIIGYNTILKRIKNAFLMQWNKI